jgi:hypothetical protein
MVQLGGSLAGNDSSDDSSTSSSCSGVSGGFFDFESGMVKPQEFRGLVLASKAR